MASASGTSSADKGLELAKALLESWVPGSTTDAAGAASSTQAGFDETSLRGLKLVSISPGQCVCRFPVTKSAQNSFETLHGGCTATLADTVSSAALATVAGPSSHVSVNLAVTYHSGMPGGEDVLVECKVSKVGRTLATIDIDFRRASTGQLVAQARHTKFIMPPTSGSSPSAGQKQQQQQQQQLLAKL